MTIIDSKGHCKWFKVDWFWGLKSDYSIVLGYNKIFYRPQVFNDIKRSRNFSVTSKVSSL